MNGIKKNNIVSQDTRLSREMIQALPKIELHLHLDCCLSYSLVSRLKPGISEADYKRDFIAPEKCKDLADFLRVIDSSLELMQTREALQWVVQDLFEQLKQDNVIYAEIRFAPFLHCGNGLSVSQVTETVEREVSRCVKESGIEARIILCTLRHFSEQQGLETVKLIDEMKGSRVTALDIAADEAGFPLDDHVAAFEYADKYQIPCTAHAGEAMGAESVRETLDKLAPTRIGHGVRSIEDDGLIELLIRNRIHLEVCPTCNIQVDVFDRYEDHPVNRLYNAGVSLSINTDTRTITNISLSEEYERLHQFFGWNHDHFLMCNRNALAASFLPDSLKFKLRSKLIYTEVPS